MALANVSFRMDEDLKRDMEETCRELGMNMTTAFVIFAKKLTRERRIPFDVAIDPFYSSENMQALLESLEQLKAGKTVIKATEELEEMAN